MSYKNELGIEILKAQEYLNKTDYKAIKWAEGVESVDEEIKEERQKCRDIINYCLEELSKIVEEQEEPIILIHE